MRPILGAARSGIVTAGGNCECNHAVYSVIMVRTQIQLTEAQARVLKRLATVQNISMAEVIRRSIDQTLAASRAPSVDDRRARALGMVGAFGSGKRDLARRHDEALAEAFE